MNTKFQPIIFYNSVNIHMNLVEFTRLVKDNCRPLPKDFQYIKSVGRAFTIVKENQMLELKVRHFCAPGVINF